MPVDDSYTKVLLHMDGADASTTFTDESGKAWTRAGAAQIDTAQSVFGGASGLFTAAADYITTGDSADWDFSTGAYTIDFRVRFTGLVNARLFSSNNTYGHLLTFTTAGGITYEVGKNGAAWLSTITVADGHIATGAWYHIAVVRESTVANATKIYIDGTNHGQGTYGDGSADAQTTGLCIAQIGWGGVSALNGWIDEFRLSKGIARWTANFTPQIFPYSAGGQVI